MRHVILFSIAGAVLAGVAAWVVTAIDPPKPPPVSNFDPFSLEEKAKNLPTQEWINRNMWPSGLIHVLAATSDKQTAAVTARQKAK